MNLLIGKSICYLFIAISFWGSKAVKLSFSLPVLLICSGILSFIYASKNKPIQLISHRNYIIGGLECVFAGLLFFANHLTYTIPAITAVFLLFMSFIQLYVVVLSANGQFKQINKLNISRALMPILIIVPCGLIIGQQQMTDIVFIHKIVLGALFFIGAILNTVFYQLFKDVKYNKRK